MPVPTRFRVHLHPQLFSRVTAVRFPLCSEPHSHLKLAQPGVSIRQKIVAHSTKEQARCAGKIGKGPMQAYDNYLQPNVSAHEATGIHGD